MCVDSYLGTDGGRSSAATTSTVELQRVHRVYCLSPLLQAPGGPEPGAKRAKQPLALLPRLGPPGDGAHGGEPSPPAASQPSNKNHQLLQAQALVLQTREALHSSRDPLLLCLSLSFAGLDIRDFFNLPPHRHLHSKCVRLYVSPPAPPLPPFLFCLLWSLSANALEPLNLYPAKIDT